MTLESLKDEVAQLSPADQRHLAAYLVALQRSKDQEFKRKLAQKIDDKNPGHWVDLDELEKKSQR
jgi:hypothetical protein